MLVKRLHEDLNITVESFHRQLNEVSHATCLLVVFQKSMKVELNYPQVDEL